MKIGKELSIGRNGKLVGITSKDISALHPIMEVVLRKTQERKTIYLASLSDINSNSSDMGTAQKLFHLIAIASIHFDMFDDYDETENMFNFFNKDYQDEDSITRMLADRVDGWLIGIEHELGVFTFLNLKIMKELAREYNAEPIDITSEWEKMMEKIKKEESPDDTKAQ